ncbi:MAG: MBL fold metallo-hydrolase [Candidatus Rehaiarchaeum fermentans]|nr:MBL fold metallo-hydrolase [Candidatus Rehaiarchaeum fermentans]MCW1293466.1 MBL fold metallo-hydrolase [Candidatus Rehaiarchaeum fermentans]
MDLVNKITDKLYEINLGYVKSFIFRTDKGLILFDTGPSNSLNKIKIALSSIQLEISQIKYIFITHTHLDHIGSLYDLKQVTGALVGINEKGLPYLTKIRFPKGHDPKSMAMAGLFRILSLRTKLKPVKVDMLIQEGYVPEEFGVKMQIISTPGHTDDSLSFYFPEEKVIIVGDLLAGAEGKLVLPPFYENKAELLNSIEKIKQLDVNTICVSHGINNTKENIKI